MRPPPTARWLIALACGVVCAASVQAARPSAERTVRATADGVRFLASQIGADGMIAGEYPTNDPRRLHGGRTAVAAWAMLVASGGDESPEARRAIDWLVKVEMDGTYPAAIRACALAEMKNPRYRAQLEADVKWLVEAANRDGAYTYVSQNGKETSTYDNSCSNAAAMGVWAGANRGVEVPRSYWQKVQRHWESQQQIDGGFGYLVPPEEGRTRSYGSMTAAGLATLFACQDCLPSDAYARCTDSAVYKPITDALAWMNANFRADQNPGKGIEWQIFWLFSVQRAGLAGGHRTFNRQDWYAAGADQLLQLQQDDGSWGVGQDADKIADTAFAVLFLARGHEPVLVGKLQYEGKWNSRPRDAANLTRWLSYNFEKPMTWRVVTMPTAARSGSPVGRQTTVTASSDWNDISILYISGAGPLDLTPEQAGRLRQFALDGGLILTEAACGSGSFTQDVQKLYAKIFPDWPMQRLDDKHAIYSIVYDARELAGLTGVSNGVRLLAVHAPRELSLALQQGAAKNTEPTFRMLANLFSLATEHGTRQPNQAARPAVKLAAPAARVRVARIAHDGNCDPEPAAWSHLAADLADGWRVELTVSVPMPPSRLNARDWPVAMMTGTRDFSFKPAEAEAVAKYLASGGTLIVDAAGGSEAFAQAVRREVLPLVPEGIVKSLPTGHPALRLLSDSQAKYRGNWADVTERRAPDRRLVGVWEEPSLPPPTSMPTSVATSSPTSMPTSLAAVAASGPASKPTSSSAPTVAPAKPSSAPTADSSPTSAPASSSTSQATSAPLQGRLVIVFSPADMTAGLAGRSWAEIHGYAPRTATELTAGLILWAADQLDHVAPSPKAGR